MMKSIVVLSAIITLLGVKCNEKNISSSKTYDEQNIIIECHFESGYQKAKKFYPIELVEHFPIRTDSNILCYSSFKSSKGYELKGNSFNTTVLSKYNASDSIWIRKIKQECRYISPMDTNIILIFDFYEDTTVYWDKLSIRHYTTPEARRVANSNLACQDCIPLPMLFNDEFFLDSTTITRISKSFGIYLIEARPGLFIDKKYLTDHPYVPENWKHGFSRGYAIDESRKIIVYWVTVW